MEPDAYFIVNSEGLYLHQLGNGSYCLFKERVHEGSIAVIRNRENAQKWIDSRLAKNFLHHEKPVVFSLLSVSAKKP